MSVDRQEQGQLVMMMAFHGSAVLLRRGIMTASPERAPSLLLFRNRPRRPCHCFGRFDSSGASFVRATNRRDVAWRRSSSCLRFSSSSLRSYSTVTHDDVEFFRSVLERSDQDEIIREETNVGSSTGDPHPKQKRRRGRVLYGDSDRLDPYNVDVTSHHRGSAVVVLLPTTTIEVSQLLRYCHDRRIPVVPQGGNTGLVGGGVGFGVVLSTNNMDQIISFDDDEGVLTCQAGCVLQNLQQFTTESNWLVPIDLGAKGSCHIGGNLATNAGGVYYYRYGSLASNLLGMEVVLPENGQVLHLGSSMRKDNTGYKLQNLMLGSEGTLGIVTSVTLQCHPLPLSQHAVWLVCPDFASVLQVRRAARRILGETLAAMEWMDSNIVKIVRDRPSTSSARSLDFLSETTESRDDHCHRHHLLIETHGSHLGHDEEKMCMFLERVLEGGFAIHGVLAQSSQQRETFWAVRESCNPAMAAQGYTYKYDVSIPVQCFDEFLDNVRERLRAHEGNHGDELSVASWGHIMDGNVHLNVHRTNDRENDPELSSALDEIVFELVTKLHGSISAEHGIGVTKKKFLSRVHAAAALNTMKSIKQLLDPHGILNPGKLF